MAIGRGIMQFGRISLLQANLDLIVYTGNTIPSVSQASGICNTTTKFSITATFYRPDGSYNSPQAGMVYIVDLLTNPTRDINQALVAGNLSLTSFTSSVNLSVVGLSNQIYNFAAVYVGIPNLTRPNESSSVMFTMNRKDTNIALSSVYTDNPGNSFCYAYPYLVQAKVTDVDNNLVTSGKVRFTIIADDETTTVPLPEGSLNSDGYAQTTVPARVTTTPQNMVLHAVFTGNDCYRPVSSGLGYHINSIVNNPTTTAISSIGSTTFCRKSSHNFLVNITPTGSSRLSKTLLDIGAVQLVATLASGGTPFNIGSVTIPVDGYATVVVPGDSIPTAAGYNIKANYIGDGNCYATSVSSDLLVTTTEQVTSLATDIPLTFNANTENIFNITVTSAIAGTINGTVILTESTDNVNIGPIDISGPHTGTIATFTIPANTFTSGSKTIICKFIGDVDVNCYGDSSSSNSVTIT